MLVKQERKRRKKMNKIEIFKFGIFKLVKGSGTSGVDIALEYQREIVCKAFELLCFIFLGVVPLPYV